MDEGEAAQAPAPAPVPPDPEEDHGESDPPPSGDPDPAPPPAPDDRTPTGVLLVDARNGFNELGRRSMLWTIRHRWAAGSWFAFNCYRHAAQLVLRRRGGPCTYLRSEEGVTQGDPLSMVLYGIALVPLAERLRAAVPQAVQAWYADDSAFYGRAAAVDRAMALLAVHGPARGYYPEPKKSYWIGPRATRQAAKTVLARWTLRYSEGQRYLGGFLGSPATQAEWLAPQLATWEAGVRTLGKVAARFPQTAYAGLAKSLQAEWQYLTRSVPDLGEVFRPVEVALAEAFLPGLFQAPPGDIPARELTALPVKWAGLSVPRPTQTADLCHQASCKCTEEVVRSLKEGRDLDVAGHMAAANESKERSRQASKDANSLTLDAIVGDTDDVRQKRRLSRARGTGAWLSTMPNRLNGTDLSGGEFRDSLRLRYGIAPEGLPGTCDGCGSRFTVDHALTCSRGGLITLRHNDVAKEWGHLCSVAYTPAAISDEPRIHTGRDGGNVAAAAAGGRPVESPPGDRGDVGVHGFWERGSTTIFDIRVTDTDAQSYRGQEPLKVLANQEKAKKAKYLDACVARRRHFTPLVFSVDGLRGPETTAAMKKLASSLSHKWERTYSQVAWYVRSRVALTLVRATHVCLHDARDPSARAKHSVWDSGSGLALY
jgi:hypothetical protein